MALPTVSPLLSLGWVCLNSVFQASTSALKHWNHPSQSPIPPPCLTLACQSMSAASHDSQSTPLPDQREICGLGRYWQAESRLNPRDISPKAFVAGLASTVETLERTDDLLRVMFASRLAQLRTRPRKLKALFPKEDRILLAPLPFLIVVDITLHVVLGQSCDSG